MITNKTKAETNTYEVEFTASEELLRAEKKRVYLKEGRKYNVPGFRKGKAPMNVIERMYGPVFTQDAIEVVYQKAVDEAISEFGEEVVDANSAEVVSMEGDVVFKAKFIVKPEVKIEGYKGLTVEKAEAVVTDEDVAHELEHLQQRNSRSINVDELAGKPAVFKVKIHEIKMTELPELNDEFAKDVSEFDTLDEYKEDLRKELLKKAEDKAKDEADNKLIDQLIDLVEADIPEVMYDNKVTENINDFSYNLQVQGMNIDTYLNYTGMDMEALRGQFRDKAIHQVKLRLALEKIAELESIEVSDEDIDKAYDDLAKNYGVELDKVRQIVPVDGLRKDVAVEKAVDVVRDNAHYVPAKVDDAE